VWVLARNALARFDGTEWTLYVTAPTLENWTGEHLHQSGHIVYPVTVVDLDGRALEPQPDFFNSPYQPYAMDITSD
jgi:hypothetical protein